MNLFRRRTACDIIQLVEISALHRVSWVSIGLSSYSLTYLLLLSSNFCYLSTNSSIPFTQNWNHVYSEIDVLLCMFRKISWFCHFFLYTLYCMLKNRNFSTFSSKIRQSISQTWWVGDGCWEKSCRFVSCHLKCICQQWVSLNYATEGMAIW